MPRCARRVAGALTLILANTCPAAAQDAFVATLIDNVVQVRSVRAGFGFIVGLRPGELLIATARHTLGDSWEPQVQVCFPPRGERCDSARITYYADAVGNQPALDLVILAVTDPGGIAWRPDAEASAEPGDDVWVIGRSTQWWVSPRPGRIIDHDVDARQVVYRDLDVAPGVSGAPIVGRNGIVAMHVQEARSEQEARGLQLAAIRERVTERVDGEWILVPRATCDDAPAQLRALAGMTVLVHMDARRPARALEAIAALHCIGARGLPHAVAEGLAADEIIYRSGDLRTARALQLLLAPLGRIEAHLGEPQHDAEIRLR
jgi:hypothetical protein